MSFRHAAFLRGMNLGGRRIGNEELRGHVEALGFQGVQTFRASGNLLLDGGRRSDETLQKLLEDGLQGALGYAVPTFIRSAAELLALAQASPFDLSRSAGKLQVVLLQRAPGAAAREEVLTMDGPADRLALAERELFWLPDGPMSDSELDWKAIERLVGPTTIRTMGTIEQLAKRCSTS